MWSNQLCNIDAKAIIGSMLFSFLLFCICGGIFYLAREQTCEKNGTISEIGVCDRYGKCGVVVKDKNNQKSKTKIKYPVLGESACIGEAIP